VFRRLNPTSPPRGNVTFSGDLLTIYSASRLRRIASHFPYLPRALRLVWTAAPGYAGIWTALLIMQGVLPVAVVYLTRSLVNALVSAVRSPAAAAGNRDLLYLGAGMAALLLLGEVARVAAGWVRTAQSELVQDHISGLIHAKSVELDLAFYDNAGFYDSLHRARSEASYRPVELLENVGGILQNGITLVSMLAVLSPFGVWMPAALLASGVPAFWIALRHASEQHRWRQRNTADERRTWYYDWVVTAVDCAAEVRLFGLGKHFQSAFQSVRSRLRTDRMRLAARQAGSELLAGFLALCAAGAALAWTGWQALRGSITLGDLAMLFQAFQQGMRLSNSLLENLRQFYSNMLFLGNLFEFLSLEPNVVNPIPASPIAPLRQALRFRRVSFRYPGTERLSLSDLELDIPAGQITAIVGANGAGKSTILKLICRFYDPVEGTVEWDGADLRTVELDSLRRSITVLFQQPVHFNETAAENIALGDVAAEPKGAAVQKAVEAAGAAEILERLPGGYDQVLGHWFENGAELSVGEWQRIALARAFFRQAPVIVLDEPTSAMDPWAEADWLDRFRHLAAGRTVVVITHRFTTARIADQIHLIDGGRIVERGTHDSLVAANGHYAQGWLAQQAVRHPPTCPSA
jgi:ATP-binding cassette subfamily B protein